MAFGGGVSQRDGVGGAEACCFGIAQELGELPFKARDGGCALLLGGFEALSAGTDFGGLLGESCERLFGGRERLGRVFVGCVEVVFEDACFGVRLFKLAFFASRFARISPASPMRPCSRARSASSTCF